MRTFTQRSQSIEYIEKYKHDLRQAQLLQLLKRTDMIQMTLISHICRKEREPTKWLTKNNESIKIPVTL